MKKKPNNNQFVLVGIFTVILLFLTAFILIGYFTNNAQNNDLLPTNLFLDNNWSPGSGNNASGKYTDKTCSVSFDYPKSWLISNTKLPLSQTPLAEVVFNEADGKNSIMSFICFDAKTYSFDQFIADSPFGQNQTETMTIGDLKWQREGSFTHTVKNNKLLIFQMFFTKYDLKPKDGYEQILLDILKSVG
jgi:hypothetical protein